MIRIEPLAIFLAIWTLAIAMFGGVHPWFEGCYFLLSGLLFVSCWRADPTDSVDSKDGRTIVLLLILAIALLALQTVPLPNAWLRILSPLAWFETVHWLQKIDVTPKSAYPLSLDPPKTFSSLSRLIGFSSLLLSTLWMVPRYRAKERIAFWVILLSALVSVLGLVHLFSGSPKVLWVFDRGHTFFGPFINRNHAGGMIACAALLSFGLLFSRTLSSMRPWIGSAFIFFLFALLFIGSRSALLTTMVFCLVHLVFQRDRAHRTMKILLSIAFTGILALSFAWKAKFFDRLHGVQEQRLAFYRQAMTLWKESPGFGSGAGTFSSLSPRLAPPLSELHAEHVENDYLETLSSTGTLGFSILILILFFISREALRVYRDPTLPTTNRAFALAYFGLLFHALFIFHMPLPSQHFLLCVLLLGFLSKHRLSFPSRWMAPLSLGLLSIGAVFAFASYTEAKEAKNASESFSIPVSPRSKTDYIVSRRLAVDLSPEVESALAKRPYDASLLFAASQIKFMAGEAEKGVLFSDALIHRAPISFQWVLPSLDAMIRAGATGQSLEIWQTRIESYPAIPAHLRAKIGYHLVESFLSQNRLDLARSVFNRSSLVDRADWQNDFYRYFLDPSHPEDLLLSSWKKFRSSHRSHPSVWNRSFFELSPSLGDRRIPALEALTLDKADVPDLMQPKDRLRIDTTSERFHWIVEPLPDQGGTRTYLPLRLVPRGRVLTVRWIASGPSVSSARGFAVLESMDRVEPLQKRTLAPHRVEFWSEKVDLPLRSLEVLTSGKSGDIRIESIEIFANF